MVIDDEFDELRREFLGEAADKISEIRQLFGSGFPLDAKARERISYLAHQLKGAGGSYGFPQISNDAADLESDVEKATDSSDELRVRIEQRISTIAQTIDERLGELTH